MNVANDGDELEREDHPRTGSIDFFSVQKMVLKHYLQLQQTPVVKQKPLQLHVHDGDGDVEGVTLDLVLSSQRVEVDATTCYELDSRPWGTRVRDTICGYRTSTVSSPVQLVTNAGRCTKPTMEPCTLARLEVHLIGVDPGTVGGHRAMQVLSKLQAPHTNGAAWESCYKPWTWAVWTQKKLLTAAPWAEVLAQLLGALRTGFPTTLYCDRPKRVRNACF